MRSTLIKCVTVIILASFLQACCMPYGPRGHRPRPRLRLTYEQTNQTVSDVFAHQTVAKTLEAEQIWS